jgi:hypothetical protein
VCYGFSEFDVPPPEKKAGKSLPPLQAALKRLDDHLLWMAQPNDGGKLSGIRYYLNKITAEFPSEGRSILDNVEFLQKLKDFAEGNTEDFNKILTDYLGPIRAELNRLDS